MDSKYIRVHLKKLVAIMNHISVEECFAREDENGMYVFGVRKPLVRNIVSRQVAIYLICGKI